MVVGGRNSMLSGIAVSLACLAVAGCGGSAASASLYGGDVGGSYAAPVVLGQTITYGAAVLHARGRGVTLLAVELVPYRGRYRGIRVRTAILGPDRGGRVIDSAFGFPAYVSGGRSEPVRGTRVVPPTGNGADYGVELLFGLTPSAYGDYRYRAVRVTYEVDGHSYARDLPAPFRMCVVSRLEGAQCNSDDLLAGDR
jgi:hypothetical protein